MNIHRFNTFEDQVAYFTERTGVHLPRMTCGKGAFFRDLGQWSSTFSSQAQDMDCAHILPDPVQGLSFPRAVDVLSTTLSLSSQTIEPDEIYALMKTFGLPREKATQPVISLSGGEMLLLNFAKAKAMLPVVDGVVACSPIHWRITWRVISPNMKIYPPKGFLSAISPITKSYRTRSKMFASALKMPIIQLSGLTCGWW